MSDGNAIRFRSARLDLARSGRRLSGAFRRLHLAPAAGQQLQTHLSLPLSLPPLMLQDESTRGALAAAQLVLINLPVTTPPSPSQVREPGAQVRIS